jgi:hypothetical protein
LYRHKNALQNNELYIVVKACPTYLRDELHLTLLELPNKEKLRLADAFSNIYNSVTGEVHEPSETLDVVKKIRKALKDINLSYADYYNNKQSTGKLYKFVDCQCPLPEAEIENQLVKKLYLEENINIDYITYTQGKYTTKNFRPVRTNILYIRVNN